MTGPDIIFFWVARMIMAGYEYEGLSLIHISLASGLIAGAVLAALLAVGSLMAEGEAALSADCLRHAIAAVAGGLVGGALCLNRRAAKRKKRWRRR